MCISSVNAATPLIFFLCGIQGLTSLFLDFFKPFIHCLSFGDCNLTKSEVRHFFWKEECGCKKKQFYNLITLPHTPHCYSFVQIWGSCVGLILGGLISSRAPQPHVQVDQVLKVGES